MPKVTFINPDAHPVSIDVRAGDTLMRAATSAGIDGIIGDCGGAMACGTCHVYVESLLSKLEAVTSAENVVLECVAAPRQKNSRLSCQIIMRDDLDGLVVRIAVPQL
jgi:ferredoxin, 2Fe-2S